MIIHPPGFLQVGKHHRVHHFFCLIHADLFRMWHIKHIGNHGEVLGHSTRLAVADIVDRSVFCKRSGNAYGSEVIGMDTIGWR